MTNSSPKEVVMSHTRSWIGKVKRRLTPERHIEEIAGDEDGDEQAGGVDHFRLLNKR